MTSHMHPHLQFLRSAAWQRKEGKNRNGGLNAKGRESYNKSTGGHLKAPLKSGNNPRRASFLHRMAGNKGPMKKPNGEPTRLALALRAWGVSSKEAAKREARRIDKHNRRKFIADLRF